MTTPFKKQCEILGELWREFREEEEWEDFVDRNDVALPMAFLLDLGLVGNPSPLAVTFIGESFVRLLGVLNLADVGWLSLEDMLDTRDGANDV